MRTKLKWMLEDSVFSGRNKRKKQTWINYFDISKEETVTKLICFTHLEISDDGRLWGFPSTCNRKCEIHSFNITLNEYELLKSKKLSKRLSYRARGLHYID